MPATPIYGLPYPATTDPPDGPGQIQALADAVEPELSRIDSTLTPLDALFASGSTVEYGDSLSGNVADFAFTPTRSALDNIEGAFVAPPSGKVKVSFRAKMRSASDAGAVLITSFIIRTGDAPGSGVVVQDASDLISIQHSGTADQSAGNWDLVPGLTPGADYNVQLVYRRSGTVDLIVTAPWVMVEPVWR